MKRYDLGTISEEKKRISEMTGKSSVNSLPFNNKNVIVERNEKFNIFKLAVTYYSNSLALVKLSRHQGCL